MRNRTPKTNSVVITTSIPQKVSLRLSATILRQVSERLRFRWWVVILYLLLCVGGAYVTSLLSGPGSFWTSIVFSVVETVIGFYAAWTVIEIIRDIERRDA
jgi:hypothetical protein